MLAGFLTRPARLLRMLEIDFPTTGSAIVSPWRLGRGGDPARPWSQPSHATELFEELIASWHWHVDRRPQESGPINHLNRSLIVLAGRKSEVSHLLSDHLVQCLVDKSPRGDTAAVEMFGKLGVTAAPASTKLARLLGRSREGNLNENVIVWRGAAEALRAWGPLRSVRPALIKCLHHPQEVVRAETAKLFGGLGPAASPAIADLIDLLSDYSPVVQEAAASPGQSGGHCPGPAVLMDLIQRLHDKASRVQLAAAWALGRLGVAGAAALPFLFQLLDDENASVRDAAAHTLEDLADSTESILPDFSRFLRDEITNVRGQTQPAQDRIGAEARQS